MGYREEFFKHTEGIHVPFKKGTFYRCVNCGGLFPKSEIDVDHRISKRYGGTDDLWNLQAMCKHCNRSKRERSSGGEIATTIVGAAVNGDIGNLVKRVATQKVKDALGIKYKRK